MTSGGSGSASPWLYKAAAVGAAVTLTAGVGYVIYKYVLLPDPEAESEAKPAISMQELLTGGAVGASRKGPSTTAVPIRKTPSPKGASRAGPTLPARKAPATTSSRAATSEAAAPTAVEAAASSSPSASSSSAAAATATVRPAAGLKSCACCGQALRAGGLPQRCGQCKSAYYCSSACQKRHWADHKPQCQKAGKGDAGAAGAGAEGAAAAAAAAAIAAGSPAAEASASTGAAAVETSDAGAAVPAVSASADETAEGAEGAATAAAADDAAAAAETAASSGKAAAESGVEEEEAAAAAGRENATPSAEGAGGSDISGSLGGGGASGSQGGGGLQNALVEVLRQAAEKGAGTLDGAFEEAVMHFLGGKLPLALKSFESLQAAARDQKRDDLVLELHKWLGHTNTKLGNFTAAADSFQAGIDAAKAAGNTAAQVDNAVGLGNLWKLVGRLTQAAEVLKNALFVAQQADHAGMQSEVLVALGNVVMAADPEEGLACLQIAVKLREDEVAKAAETGDRAGMATGMMQAAAAMVNMAAALFATRRFEQSKQAYEQAMEIFELMEDHEKVVQVLINLANLAELQLNKPGEALEYREKLSALLRANNLPDIADGAETTPCGVCKQPIAVHKARARSDDKAAMVLLGCLHVQHDCCFKDWSDRTLISAEALAAGLAAGGGGEAAAAVAATAASPGARRTTTCPTCSAPVPVMS